jgi:lipid A 3-O-deacylase
MRKKLLFLLFTSFFWCCSDLRHEETEIGQPLEEKYPEETELRIHPGKEEPGNHTTAASSEKEKPVILKLFRKRHKEPSFTAPPSSLIQTARHDSLFLQKMKSLRLEDVDLDFSEPISRAYLFSGPGKVLREDYISISRERILKINFENDLLDNTDRYYTNGIRIDIISPFLRSFPLNYLMIPYWGAGTNYYGISIIQNMYTPSTTKTGGILYGDRPYAATLTIRNFKITNDPVKRFRQSSELDLGVIGPYSLGGFIQKTFHENIPTNTEPLGWFYQVQNDVILNYNLTFEKGIINNRSFDFNLVATSSFGTLFTNAGAGFMIRAGRFNPYFLNLGILRPGANHQQRLKNSQIYFFLNIKGKVIGYDATLQGGIFNRTSIYTLSSKSVSRFIADGCAGITLNLGGVRLDVGQFLLSPEFHGGMWHHWVQTGVTFAL